MRVAAQIRMVALAGFIAAGFGASLQAAPNGAEREGAAEAAAAASCMRPAARAAVTTGDETLGAHYDLSDACVPQPALNAADGAAGSSAAATPDAAAAAPAASNTAAPAGEASPSTEAEGRSIFGFLGAVFLGVIEFVVSVLASVLATIAGAFGAAAPVSAPEGLIAAF